MGSYQPTTTSGAPAGAGSATSAAPNPFSNTTPSSDFDVVTGTNSSDTLTGPDGKHYTTHFSPIPTTSSATSMLGDLSAMTVPDLLALQDRLVAAGYLSRTNRSGIADANTRHAYTLLLEDTSRMNAHGLDVTPLDVLDRGALASGGLAFAGAGGSQALHQYSPTDPARVRQTAEAAFQAAIGKKGSKAQIEAFVSHFMTAEIGAQQTVFNAADQVATGQAVTAGPVDAGSSITMDGHQVGGTVGARIQAMMAAAPGKIGIASGTRSHTEQAQLYANYRAGKGNLAAPPGHSKHELGLAADLKFASPGVRDWAHANAARFGLVFPIASESWHVEPIGNVPAAGQAAPAAGGVSQSVIAVQPDLGAQATEYAQNQNPVESQAYGVGQQFDNLVSLLKGGVI
jgi:hypothetical protein